MAAANPTAGQLQQYRAQPTLGSETVRRARQNTEEAALVADASAASWQAKFAAILEATKAYWADPANINSDLGAHNANTSNTLVLSPNVPLAVLYNATVADPHGTQAATGVTLRTPGALLSPLRGATDALATWTGYDLTQGNNLATLIGQGLYDWHEMNQSSSAFRLHHELQIFVTDFNSANPTATVPKANGDVHVLPDSVNWFSMTNTASLIRQFGNSIGFVAWGGRRGINVDGTPRLPELNDEVTFTVRKYDANGNEITPVNDTFTDYFELFNLKYYYAQGQVVAHDSVVADNGEIEASTRRMNNFLPTGDAFRVCLRPKADLGETATQAAREADLVSPGLFDFTFTVRDGSDEFTLTFTGLEIVRAQRWALSDWTNVTFMKGEQSFVTQPTALSNTTQPAMQMTQTGGDGLVQYQLGADSTATVESARNTFASVDLHPGNSDGIVLSKPNSTKRVTVNSYNGLAVPTVPVNVVRRADSQVIESLVSVQYQNAQGFDVDTTDGLLEWTDYYYYYDALVQYTDYVKLPEEVTTPGIDNKPMLYADLSATETSTTLLDLAATAVRQDYQMTVEHSGTIVAAGLSSADAPIYETQVADVQLSEAPFHVQDAAITELTGERLKTASTFSFTYLGNDIQADDYLVETSGETATYNTAATALTVAEETTIAVYGPSGFLYNGMLFHMGLDFPDPQFRVWNTATNSIQADLKFSDGYYFTASGVAGQARTISRVASYSEPTFTEVVSTFTPGSAAPYIRAPMQSEKELANDHFALLLTDDKDGTSVVLDQFNLMHAAADTQIPYGSWDAFNATNPPNDAITVRVVHTSSSTWTGTTTHADVTGIYQDVGPHFVLLNSAGQTMHAFSKVPGYNNSYAITRNFSRFSFHAAAGNLGSGGQLNLEGGTGLAGTIAEARTALRLADPAYTAYLTIARGAEMALVRVTGLSEVQTNVLTVTFDSFSMHGSDVVLTDTASFDAWSGGEPLTLTWYSVGNYTMKHHGTTLADFSSYIVELNLAGITSTSTSGSASNLSGTTPVSAEKQAHIVNNALHENWYVSQADGVLTLEPYAAITATSQEEMAAEAFAVNDEVTVFYVDSDNNSVSTTKPINDFESDVDVLALGQSGSGDYQTIAWEDISYVVKKTLLGNTAVYIQGVDTAAYEYMPLTNGELDAAKVAAVMGGNASVRLLFPVNNGADWRNNLTTGTLTAQGTIRIAADPAVRDFVPTAGSHTVRVFASTGSLDAVATLDTDFVFEDSTVTAERLYVVRNVTPRNVNPFVRVAEADMNLANYPVVGSATNAHEHSALALGGANYPVVSSSSNAGTLTLNLPVGTTLHNSWHGSGWTVIDATTLHVYSGDVTQLSHLTQYNNSPWVRVSGSYTNTYVGGGRRFRKAGDMASETAVASKILQGSATVLLFASSYDTSVLAANDSYEILVQSSADTNTIVTVPFNTIEVRSNTDIPLGTRITAHGLDNGVETGQTHTGILTEMTDGGFWYNADGQPEHVIWPGYWHQWYFTYVGGVPPAVSPALPIGAAVYVSGARVATLLNKVDTSAGTDLYLDGSAAVAVGNNVQVRDEVRSTIPVKAAVPPQPNTGSHVRVFAWDDMDNVPSTLKELQEEIEGNLERVMKALGTRYKYYGDVFGQEPYAATSESSSSYLTSFPRSFAGVDEQLEAAIHEEYQNIIDRGGLVTGVTGHKPYYDSTNYPRVENVPNIHRNGQIAGSRRWKVSHDIQVKTGSAVNNAALHASTQPHRVFMNADGVTEDVEIILNPQITNYSGTPISISSPGYASEALPVPGWVKRSGAGGHAAPVGTTVRVYSYTQSLINSTPLLQGELVSDDGTAFSVVDPAPIEVRSNTAIPLGTRITAVAITDDRTETGTLAEMNDDGFFYYPDGQPEGTRWPAYWHQWYFTYTETLTYVFGTGNSGLGDYWYTWLKPDGSVASQGAFFHDGASALTGQPVEVKDGANNWYWEFQGNAPDAQLPTTGVQARAYALFARNDSHVYTAAVIVKHDGTVDSITLTHDLGSSLRDALVLSPLSVGSNLILDADTTYDDQRYDARLQLRIPRDAAGNTYFKTIRFVDNATLAAVNAMLAASLPERSAQNASANMQYRLLIRNGGGTGDTGFEVSNIFDTASVNTSRHTGIAVYSDFVAEDPHLATDISSTPITAGIGTILWRPTLDQSAVFLVDIVGSPSGNATAADNCGDTPHPMAQRRTNTGGNVLGF